MAGDDPKEWGEFPERMWDLEDFLRQLEVVKGMGPLTDLVKRVPGLEALVGEIDPEEAASSLESIARICEAMTPEERRDPEGFVGPGGTLARARVAEVAGVEPDEVESFVEQFLDMRTRVRAMMKGGGPPPRSADRSPPRRRESTMALTDTADTDTFEERVDEVLRKITRSGLASLSKDERALLEQASRVYKDRQARGGAPASAADDEGADAEDAAPDL